MNNAATTHHPDTETPSPTAAWRAYQGVTSGPVDEKELIERYLPLVRNVVDRIKLTLPAHIDADDLHSVGITGLIAAVRKYNPDQGNTFAGYAATRIRGAILDELRRMDWCPRRVRARARKLKEAINALEQRLGRAATEEEICTDLGMSRKEYAEWLDESRPVTFIAIDHDRRQRGVRRLFPARVSVRRVGRDRSRAGRKAGAARTSHSTNGRIARYT